MSKIITILLYILFIIIIIECICFLSIYNYLQYREYYEYIDLKNVTGRASTCFIEKNKKYCRDAVHAFEVKTYQIKQERKEW